MKLFVIWRSVCPRTDSWTLGEHFRHQKKPHTVHKKKFSGCGWLRSGCCCGDGCCVCCSRKSRNNIKNNKTTTTRYKARALVMTPPTLCGSRRTDSDKEFFCRKNNNNNFTRQKSTTFTQHFHDIYESYLGSIKIDVQARKMFLRSARVMAQLWLHWRAT